MAGRTLRERARTRRDHSRVEGALGRGAIDYLPRVSGPKGQPKTAPDPEIIKEINDELNGVNWAGIPTTDLDALCTRFRESLDEAKKQTEYQDQKATGLLTTISIFGALAGLILSQMIDNYPLEGPRPIGGWVLVGAAYGLFALFVVLISTGAMVVFHANRTRFRYTEGSTPFRMSTPGQTPRSRLFYQQISKAQPADWAKQIDDWQQEAAAPGAPADQVGRALRVAYLRDYVVESYLVACKTYDKIRYLIPAQTLMFWATRLFVIWIFVLAALLVCVPRDKTAKNEVKVGVDVSLTPAPIRPVGPVATPPLVTAKAYVKPAKP